MPWKRCRQEKANLDNVKRCRKANVDIIDENNNLKRILQVKSKEIDLLNDRLMRLDNKMEEKNTTVMYYRQFAVEHSKLQKKVRILQKNIREAQRTKAKNQLVQKTTMSFASDDPLLTEASFKTFMVMFTTIMSKKFKNSMTANDFVVLVYAPYYDEAFGKCCVPRIDEILDECHFDEVREKVMCSLSASDIKKYFLQYATVKHFEEIYNCFDKFKQTSYVLQRLWDMGYHQAKDVVQGLEKHNVPFLERLDGAWKSVIFGVQPGRCFVSGDPQKGVGDHIQPVRANRHVTGCYGGNSKWNLAPVISALNQPYKNMVLFLPEQGQFHKICLDNATFENVSFANFVFEDEASFRGQYASKRTELESQRLNCLVRLRNFYKNNSHVQRLDNAILVKNSEHLFRLIEQTSNVNVGLLKSIVALPACSQRTHIPNFLEVLVNQISIMDQLKSNIQSTEFTPDLLYCLFTDKRKKNFADVEPAVERLFPDSVGIKKAYRALWVKLGLMHVVDFLKNSNAIKLIKWMQTKENKKLYQRVDALDIYMRLHLWQAYVSSIRRENKVPKMEWNMSADDFDKIEDILKKGVQIIHDGTHAFIQETRKKELK